MNHKAEWRKRVGYCFEALAEAFQDDQKHPIVVRVTIHDAAGEVIGEPRSFDRRRVTRVQQDIGPISKKAEEGAEQVGEGFLTVIVAEAFKDTERSQVYGMATNARSIVVQMLTSPAGPGVLTYPITERSRKLILQGLDEMRDEVDADNDPTDKAPEVEHGDNGTATAETETAAIVKPGTIQEFVGRAFNDPKPLPGREGTFPDPDVVAAGTGPAPYHIDFDTVAGVAKIDGKIVEEPGLPKARQFGPADVIFLIRTAEAKLIEALQTYKAIGLHVGIVTAGGALIPINDRPRLVEADLPDDPQVESTISRLHFLAVGDGAHLATWLELDDEGRALKVASWSLNRFPLDIGFKTLSSLSDGYRNAMLKLSDPFIRTPIPFPDQCILENDPVTDQENETGRYVVYQPGIPAGDLLRRYTLNRALKARDEAAPNHSAVLSIRDSLHF